MTNHVSMNTQAIDAKRAEAEKIRADTERFLARGKKITEVPAGVYSHDPLPLRIEGARNGWDNRGE